MSYIDFRNNAAQGSFQNALGMGFQFGQQIRQRREEKEYRNALANYDPNNPESVKGVMAVDPRLGIQLRREGDAARQAAQQGERDAVPVVLNMLKAAQANPEQYGAILAQAQRLGIPGVEAAPQQFDPDWVESQIATLSAFATPQGREALSTVGKEAVDAGLQPGTPEFSEFVRSRLLAGDRKTIPFQPGGGVIEYDPNTGETRILAAPSGAPGVMQVPPPPEGFTLDVGGAGGNASGGF